MIFEEMPDPSAASSESCMQCPECIYTCTVYQDKGSNSHVKKHTRKAVQQFWQTRTKGENGQISKNQKTVGPSEAVFWKGLFKPFLRKMDQSSSELPATCLASQSSSDRNYMSGCAILDTGASRSVIGIDHVPAVLQKLHPSVRSLVQEHPSRIGFRFGNNQIEFSFKQLRIPLTYHRKRIWLLIEVVPKATPFLLSIKTMKRLGAKIDLEENTCFLKHIQRSLQLIENKNGLYMIDMSELRQPSEQHVSHTAAAFVTSSDSTLSAPPGLDLEVPNQHADSSPSPRHVEEPSRGSAPDTSHVDDSHFHVDHSNRARPGDGTSTVRSDSIPSTGSDTSTSISGRTGSADSEPDFAEDTKASKTRDDHEPNDWTTIRNRFPRFPKCLAGTGRRGNGYAPLSGAKYFPQSASTTDACAFSSQHSSYASSSEPSQSSGQSESQRWSPCSQSPIAEWPRTSYRPHYRKSGEVGSKENHLGSKTHGKDIRRGLRERQKLSDMADGSHPKHGRGGERFRELHPHKEPPDMTPEKKGKQLGVWESLESAKMPTLSDRSIMWNTEEAKLLQDAIQFNRKFHGLKRALDLLEVYAYPNSRLTEIALENNMRARRFSKEDGDLSTHEGRVQLIALILREQPKDVWMSPECGPWCAWNRFNEQRSITSMNKIQTSQQEARVHLFLCNLVCKIQRSLQSHFHMENPLTSSAWKQPELQDVMQMTLSIQLDQCMFGLRHPESNDPMQKRTRLQSTSYEMFYQLDSRLCKHQHKHAQIAGQCHWKGHSIAVSKFAGFYPRQFAKAIIRTIQDNKKHKPFYLPVYHIDSLENIDDRPTKRARTEEETREPDTDMQETPDTSSNTADWKPVFDLLKQELPKSGLRTWTNPFHEVFRCVQQNMPDHSIGAIKAGKGLDKYITGEHTWDSSLPIRRTISLRRFTNEIEDLGSENWGELSRAQQHRRAVPSHILLCIFSEKTRQPPTEVEDQDVSVPVRVPTDVTPTMHDEGSPTTVDVPTWTPQAVTTSGPKFLNLTKEQQSEIIKLHRNLGHPVSTRLSRHLAEAGAHPDLVAGAKDYLCPSCVERTPPGKTTPGNLKEPTEFNEQISLDGFIWSNSHGISVYVLHIIDEATRFHLGSRTSRDSTQTMKTLNQTWIQWAGPPVRIAHDQGGEFLSQEWKDYLQSNSVRPILSAAAWQRGRIERHGGIIKDMLDRMNHDKPITTMEQFDEILQQCFRAKNTLSIVQGYTPEQAVLGRASRLPASIVSDEQPSSHDLSLGDDLASEKFRRQLDLRQAAREAFLKADNSDALRRAFHRQSRGTVHHWSCGQLCMYWDKRKAPNMLEKGRWNGPAQVVCEESRTIVWVTHLNRLLRCAKENLRPVSLREFQTHSTFQSTSNPEQLKQMASRLQSQLRQRSGLFQYGDLSTLEGPEERPHSEDGTQPEEEPSRRPVPVMQPDTDLANAEIARNTPVPDSPRTQQDENNVNPESQESPGASTASLDTDTEGTVTDHNMEPVYNATILEQPQENATCVADQDTIWEDLDSHQECCASFAFDVPKQMFCKFLKTPQQYFPCLVAAAKKAKTEVSYKDLNDEEKLLFQKAKAKELQCWLDTDTVVAIMRDRIHPSRVMSSRWILTWKEDISQPNGRKPKARLVVKGFQDPDIGILSSDSPTLTRDARMLLMQTVSSNHWNLQSFDITTAFLRGRSDERELAMEAPPELKTLLNMTENQVCLLKGNAYGRVDAPLLFYKELRRHLEDLGFTPHPLDNCLFLLRNQQDPSKLDGILGTHVDDGIGGGNAAFEHALHQLQKKMPFGTREYSKFKFTGLDVEQLPDYSIKVCQSKYIHQIRPIDISKGRRSETESPITAQELHHLRGLCGSLQYAAVHSRPDIAAKVAGLQKGIGKATVETLLEGNRVLREAQTFADTAVIIRPIPIKDLCFASFGDASFASAKQLSAQQGIFIMACTPKLSQNETTDFSPMVWHTKQIGRVVRSTLSAEAYAMSSSLDKLTWIRCMWGYIKDPTFAWHRPEVSLKTEHPGLMITDCKSLYDLVTKTATPNCQEWRTTIEVMLLKEQSKEHTVCRWISTAIMLADCLTKSMDATFLRTVLQLGKFRIYDEDLTLKQNANRKFSVSWVNNRI